MESVYLQQLQMKCLASCRQDYLKQMKQCLSLKYIEHKKCAHQIESLLSACKITCPTTFLVPSHYVEQDHVDHVG